MLLCYLDKDGKLFCRKFSIEEEKVINNSSYFVDLKKLFQFHTFKSYPYKIRVNSGKRRKQLYVSCFFIYPMILKFEPH
jgi:hypothetical protein